MKKVTLILLLGCIFALGITSVSADIGPKPSLKITIEGINEEYVFELLSATEDDIGVNLEVATLDDFEEYEYTHYKGVDFPEEFVRLHSELGLYSQTLYGFNVGSLRQTDTHEYQHNYYPPRTFQMVLLLEDGTTIISEQVVRTMFDTVMVWNVSDIDKTVSSEGLGVIEGNMGIGTPEDFEGYNRLAPDTIIRTVIRMILTVGIELIVLFLFKFRDKKTYLFVIVVNLFTQGLLSFYVVTSLAFNGAWNAMITLFIGEMLVFMFEILLYIAVLKEKGPGRAALYGFIANLVTLITGFFLIIYI